VIYSNLARHNSGVFAFGRRIIPGARRLLGNPFKFWEGRLAKRKTNSLTQPFVDNVDPWTVVMRELILGMPHKAFLPEVMKYVMSAEPHHL